MLGRVMSLSSISQRGIGGFGNFQVGALAAVVGVPVAVALGAAVCVGMTVLYAVRVPALRTFTGSGEELATDAARSGERARSSH